jgi:hypothetical protein
MLYLHFYFNSIVLHVHMSSPNSDLMPSECPAVVAWVCPGLRPVNVAFALLILICLYNWGCSVDIKLIL